MASAIVLVLVGCSSAPERAPLRRPPYAEQWQLRGGAGESACGLGWGCPPAVHLAQNATTDSTVAVTGEPEPPPGTCREPVATSASCGTAFVAYCDCDGATFFARERCPDRPWVADGACRDEGEVVRERWTPDEAPDPHSRFRATACTGGTSCGRGRVCWGIEGCTTTWTCERVRGCPRETDQWCSCDGETFTASRGCPGRPVRHRGPCAPAP